jgi:hypothetical protein
MAPRNRDTDRTAAPRQAHQAGPHRAERRARPDSYQRRFARPFQRWQAPQPRRSPPRPLPHPQPLRRPRDRADQHRPYLARPRWLGRRPPERAAAQAQKSSRRAGQRAGPTTGHSAGSPRQGGACSRRRNRGAASLATDASSRDRTLLPRPPARDPPARDGARTRHRQGPRTCPRRPQPQHSRSQRTKSAYWQMNPSTSRHGPGSLTSENGRALPLPAAALSFPLPSLLSPFFSLAVLLFGAFFSLVPSTSDNVSAHETRGFEK